MNGQYLMNKEISVQYAYKKDGKGERHGDQAERMLASQALKHGVQPLAQPIPVGLFNAGPLNDPAATLDVDGGRPPFMNGGRPAVPNGSLPSAPLAPPRPIASLQPLPPPPTGLPQRPPPSQAGYGGPQGYLPSPYNPAQQQVFASSNAPPPPGFNPPGLRIPTIHGNPPGMPTGFQPPPLGGGR